MSNKEFKLSEIAKKLDLSFEGDPNYKVNSIKNLKEAGKFDISFYYSKKFKKDLEETNAGIVLLEKNDDTNSIKNKLFSENVHLSYARLSQIFEPSNDYLPFIDESSVIHKSAKISSNSHIGPNCHIEKDVLVEEGVVIKSNVTIGSGTKIKKNTFINSLDLMSFLLR